MFFKRLNKIQILQLVSFLPIFFVNKRSFNSFKIWFPHNQTFQFVTSMKFNMLNNFILKP